MSTSGTLRDDARKFITTEPFSDAQSYEKRVWDAVRNAFSDRECMGYSHYPLFKKTGEQRDEPDILVADKEVGLTVIEVRPYTIDQINEIVGEAWHLQGASRIEATPARAASTKLKQLISFLEGDQLFRLIGGRAFVALPQISHADWAASGLDQQVGDAAILLKDDLGPKTLHDRILNTTPRIPARPLNDEQWTILQGALGGTVIYKKTAEGRTRDTSTRAGVITELKERLHALDLQQEQIGKQIPPGPQRIRGIAGSGKSVLLCQKAAHMHLKHPDWEIAFVFFTRSLYDQIERLINQWIKRFSGGEKQQYDPEKLHILHAWGANDQAGFYRTICNAVGESPVRPRRDNGTPAEQLAKGCSKLLDQHEIEPLFDAVLVDEGQDLVVDDDLRFEGKQPIYWLMYQSLRACNDEEDRRRIIWAYDEAQSLDALKIPQAKELFGDELSRIVSGTYPGGIKKSEIMSRCYRTPGPILVAAHALGMGLKRKDGMIAGFTRQDQWEAIGYEVEGNFVGKGEVTITRDEKNSPNPVPDLWDGDVLEFNTFETRDEELEAVAQRIRRNLDVDEMSPSRNILVIAVGKGSYYIRRKMASILQNHGIDSYTPTALDVNIVNPRWPDIDSNKFWHRDGVTVAGIHRAKGNEAEMVYVVGLDKIAKDEANRRRRNELFVALTRSKGWVHVSGIREYPLYDEVRSIMEAGNSLTFTFTRPSEDLSEPVYEEAA